MRPQSAELVGWGPTVLQGRGIERRVPRLLAVFDEAGAAGAGRSALLALTPGFGNAQVPSVRLAPAVHTHVTGAPGKLAGST